MQFLSENLISEDNFFLNEEESFHLKKVLRARTGDKIKVFDGEKRWLCEIIDFKNSRVFLKPLELIKTEKKQFKLNLFFPFIERKKFEYVIKTVTEAGIDSFTPLITEYTQKHFIFNIKDRKERIYDILKSAVKQSERDSFPEINNAENISDIFENEKKFIVMSKEKINGRLYKLFDIINNTDKEINIIIGPEAGFSQKDVSFMNENVYPLKISDNILRSETAAVGSVCMIAAVMSIK